MSTCLNFVWFKINIHIKGWGRIWLARLSRLKANFSLGGWPAGRLVGWADAGGIGTKTNSAQNWCWVRVKAELGNN